ncbi:hypothetical protein KJ840_01285 [Patescibacteria group bacterium]|nr:hypothetical protein [Patescibacteria group bacterium]
MKKRKIIILSAIISLTFYPLFNARGVVSFYETNLDFNPSNIVSDSALTDYNSMTIEQIKAFVESQGGTLGYYIDPEVKLFAYYIIWQAAQDFHINPKFLITMLQKEQSLVTDDEPTQGQYDWATGYSCYGGICLDQYKGFSRQVRATANKFINSYLADLNILDKHKDGFYCTFTKWCIGDPKETQDQQLIIPQNKVTCALYTYNPYRGGTVVDGMKVGANYNFWKIWQNWFTSVVFRPNGSLLKTINNDTVYLIKDGKKRPFKNFSALITRYDPENIIIVEQTELDGFEDGPAIEFTQYSLLQTETGDIYLVDGEKLRLIADMGIFQTLGFNPEEVEDVTEADIADMPRGSEINIYSSYPTGALIQDSSTGGVYFVQNGIKYPIFSPEILEINYPNYSIVTGHPEELAKYSKGEAVKFKDGTLIKAKDNPEVYFIADGRKLPIVDEQAFVSRGYRWDKIIETTQAAVDIHPTGPFLEAIENWQLPQLSSPTATSTSNILNPDNIYEEVESLQVNPITTPPGA